MINLAIIGTSLVLAGGVFSAVVALRQQKLNLMLFELESSDNSHMRRIARKARKAHPDFHRGLKARQRRLFWFGIWCVLLGTTLQWFDLVLPGPGA